MAVKLLDLPSNPCHSIRMVLRMLSLGAAESLLAVVADLPQRKSTKQRMKLRSAS
jgi:hypothetical protein